MLHYHRRVRQRLECSILEGSVAGPRKRLRHHVPVVHHVERQRDSHQWWAESGVAGERQYIRYTNLKRRAGRSRPRLIARAQPVPLPVPQAGIFLTNRERATLSAKVTVFSS